MNFFVIAGIVSSIRGFFTWIGGLLSELFGWIGALLLKFFTWIVTFLYGIVEFILDSLKKFIFWLWDSFLWPLVESVVNEASQVLNNILTEVNNTTLSSIATSIDYFINVSAVLGAFFLVFIWLAALLGVKLVWKALPFTG